MRGLALLALLLVTPSAFAGSVEGALEVAGEVELPAGSTLRSEPAALFVEDARGIVSGGGSAPLARIRLYEETYVAASVLGQRPMVRLSSRAPTWEAEDLVVRLEEGKPGWLGLHAQKGTLVETATSPVALAAAAKAEAGNGRAGTDDGDPSQPFYLVRADGPTVERSATSWTYAGAGAVKIMGPTVHLKSRTNETTVETGETRDPQDPSRLVVRWLVLEFAEGELALEGPHAKVLSRTLDARWDGAASLARARGTLMGDGRAWDAGGGATVLDGALAAHVTPGADGASLVLGVTGDLRSTSLAARTSPAGFGAGASWWPALLLLAAAVAGGIGAFAVRRQRLARRPALGAEEYAALAERAADAEDFAQAARWTEEARRTSPSSRRLALDHAYYLERSGRRDDAFRLLREPLLGEDPDAHVLLTTLHLAAGDEDAAARALRRALALSPLVLYDVETDPQLARVRARPDVRDALREARRKLR